MCGAGVLPARMAGEARRQGWRVVAFVFGPGAPGVDVHADCVVPSRLAEIGAILERLRDERVTAVLFTGKLEAGAVLGAEGLDAAARAIRARAGSLVDVRLLDAVTATLGTMGITVLDQRPFAGDWLGAAGCLTRRTPSDAEWADVRRGLGLARWAAEARIGQTVVVKHGVVTALEAAEGTTEAVRRGTALGGPGTVVVKAVARDHDYRFDTPAIGPETLAVAAAGGAAVVAVEAARVLILDRATTVARAEAAGVALVGVDADATAP